MQSSGCGFWNFSEPVPSLAECTLAQIYKEKKFGEYRGGPAFYMEKALGQKWLGVLFALFCAIGNVLLIPGVHSNSITTSLENAFHIPTYIGGILLAILMAVIIFGNVKRIAKVSELVVPFMSVAYIVLALIVIFANIKNVPEDLPSVFASAFGADAVFAGMLGSAIVWGVKRGVNSCSAGMGTAPQSGSSGRDFPSGKAGYGSGGIRICRYAAGMHGNGTDGAGNEQLQCC